MDAELGYVNPMFVVPIVYYPIENWSENKKKILDALPAEDETQLQFEDLLTDPKENGLYTDFFINSKAGKEYIPSYFHTVLGVIKPCIADLTERVVYDAKGEPSRLFGEKSLEFVDMWYQKYYKNVEHKVHCHGNSGWSAVIYVEFDPEVHHSTMFYSPFRKPWNGNIETFQPPISEGDMIIFPSSILHEAPMNRSDKRRTIISFNIRGHVDTVKHVESTIWDDKK